jgi:hypothetical protein
VFGERHWEGFGLHGYCVGVHSWDIDLMHRLETDTKV